MTRHMRTHSKTPYKQVDGKLDNVYRDKKGTNFFLTFQKQVKKELSDRLYKIEEIKQYIICDETGASGHSNPHSHCVVVLKEKLNFVEFKNFWVATYELPMYQDVESCRNLRQSFKYCSKEDHLCDFAAVDADYLHIHTQSFLASQRYSILSNTSYPYCRMQGVNRREFEQRFREWKIVEQSTKGEEENKNCTLRAWQKATVNLLDNQDDRQVLWIHDSTGFNAAVIIRAACRR